MGQNFTRSVERLLILSQRYVMVTCLTHEDGVGGWVVERREWGEGGGKAKPFVFLAALLVIIRCRCSWGIGSHTTEAYPGFTKHEANNYHLLDEVEQKIAICQWRADQFG